MTQEQPERKSRAKRAATDEGAAYTRAVMREVKRLRQARDWSAERLAEEMAKAGIPWTRDTVTNLETGRRKHIAAHEVLALAWLLDVRSPVDLFVPSGERYVPVLPERQEYASVVRQWFEGKTGPLRQRPAGSPEGWAAFLEEFAEATPEAGITPEDAQRIIEVMSSHRRDAEGGDDS